MSECQFYEGCHGVTNEIAVIQNSAMNGEDQLAPSTPCWEGIAVGGDIGRSCLDGGTLGRKRDVPHSLRLHSNRGYTGSIFVSEEEPASLSSIRSDSRLNSLEYWDYALELECMQGSQGKKFEVNSTSQHIKYKILQRFRED